MSTNEALACLRRGDAAGAEAALARVLAENPRDLDALNMRAVARHQAGDLAGAVEALDAALAIDPHQPTTHFNRGDLLQAAGRYADAVEAYARSLELMPRDPEAWVHRAAAERALGRDADSAQSCLEALRWEADNQQALNDGAAALGRLERFEEALALIDRLIVLTPNAHSAHTNRGKILAGLDRYEEAIAAYQTALKLNAQHGPAWNNLGVAYAALGRFKDAAGAYERAAALPSHHLGVDHPLFNRSASLLMMGDYAQGLALYAQRFDAGITAKPAAMGAAPRWKGDTLTGGALRIMCEQGVGDQILFSRLLPLVLARTPRVVVDCDARLGPLLQRTHPNLEAVITPAASFVGATAELAMGDIAGVLGLTPKDIGRLPAIMRVDQAKTKALRAKYEALAEGRPIVGVSWASPKAKLARNKSAGIEHWGALLREPYFFVSLQYGDVTSDIQSALMGFGADIHVDADINQMRSLDDFAAQIAALDCVVTVSNTTAHVAGALGRDCIVLVPPGRGLHWYWGAEGERTPWYPSVKLVRRAVGQAWSRQIADAAMLLQTSG